MCKKSEGENATPRIRKNEVTAGIRKKESVGCYVATPNQPRGENKEQNTNNSPLAGVRGKNILDFDRGQ
jgi:hypothetical protein